MKISKLFHWLYAFLMLLPVFFIGGRCLYVTFNKNAKDSYYGETINEEENVNATSLNINTIYTYSIQNDSYTFSQSEFSIYLDTITVIQNTYTVNLFDTKKITIRDDGTTLRYTFYDDSNTSLGTYYSNWNSVMIFTFHYVGTNYMDRLQNYLNNSHDITYKVYNKFSYLDNAFIYSVNELNTIPLFSWAKTSFLVEPFTYISGLFGIESTSPINTMLSYWLAISIIWLVFDLIMYVPLLVHRWIDKAKLE